MCDIIEQCESSIQKNVYCVKKFLLPRMQLGCIANLAELLKRGSGIKNIPKQLDLNLKEGSETGVMLLRLGMLDLETQISIGNTQKTDIIPKPRISVKQDIMFVMLYGMVNWLEQRIANVVGSKIGARSVL